MQKITLYGFGYVGKAVFNFLKDHYGVEVVDPHAKEADKDGVLPGDKYPAHNFFENREQMLEGLKGFWSKHAVICVPTPMSEDGSCDTSIVEEILKNTKHEFYLIKSTVPPGTIDYLASLDRSKKIAFSPEYIGEGKYEIPYWLNYPHPTNMKVHSFHIFGGEKEATTEWVNVWQRIAGWTANYQQTDARTAEMVKYAENMFLATKKIFCDELYEVCQALGIDYNTLKELWLLDGRIGRPMTMIFPDARGYSGKCLPKDTNAIVKRAEQAGYTPELWRQVIASNKKFRKE